jgi:hypothetical protein
MALDVVQTTTLHGFQIWFSVSQKLDLIQLSHYGNFLCSKKEVLIFLHCLPQHSTRVPAIQMVRGGNLLETLYIS